MAPRKAVAVPSGPITGDTYELVNAEGHGAGLGHIANGARVTVAGVHPEGTPGVGHAGGRSVVVNHEHSTHVLTADGHAPGTAVRSFALPVDDFERLFTKVAS